MEPIKSILGFEPLLKPELETTLAASFVRSLPIHDSLSLDNGARPYSTRSDSTGLTAAVRRAGK